MATPKEESTWEERHPIAARFLDEAHAYFEGHESEDEEYFLSRLAGYIEFVAAAPEEGPWLELAAHQAESTAADFLEFVGWLADINELSRTKGKAKRQAVLDRQMDRQSERLERRIAKAEERHEVWKAERAEKTEALEAFREAHRPRISRGTVGFECGCACGWFIALPTRDNVKAAHQAHVREVRP